MNERRQFIMAIFPSLELCPMRLDVYRGISRGLILCICAAYYYRLHYLWGI